MPKRMIRIFVSSTFRNFEEERQALNREVYFQLEDLCRRNGFSFQIIDLRWGISIEDSQENLTAQICFDEIARCQKLSPEINFLIMAGARYGWRPLPAQISPEEWGLLTGGIPAEDAGILSAYYRQDHNDQNQPYILRSKKEIRDSGCTAETAYVHELLWIQAEKHLEGRELEKYRASATEQEIMLGYEEAASAMANTFIMIKADDDPDPKETNLDRERAASLRKRLETSADHQQLCIYRKNESHYKDDALKFLKEAIERQIDFYQKLSAYHQEQEVLQKTYQEISRAYIPLPGHGEALAYFQHGGGCCTLLTGPSGSGKSWLLRHLAASLTESGQTVAAVFNDIQPLGRSFRTALAFLAESLLRSGALKTNALEPQDPKYPAAWFGRVLQSVRRDRNVTVILDCIDKVVDYKRAEQGLFPIKIPPNVKIIVSAISAGDLHPSDLVTNSLREFPLKPLLPQDGQKLLCLLLEKNNRRLQQKQLEAAGMCLRQNQQELSSALAIELLSQICGRLHCWDPFPYTGTLDFHSLVQITLFHENRNGYHELRRHALGYLALSSIGLSETELIDLLSRDKSVEQEIRSQTKWDFELFSSIQQDEKSSSYTGKIPFVLWALLYAQLSPFLTDLEDDGMILLQFRHARLKEEVLRGLSGDVQTALLENMRRYYGEGKWLLSGGKTVLANRRKVCELFPVCEKLQDEAFLQRELEDPLCVDAYVRCGMIQAVRDYMARFAVSERALGMLGQLRRKDLLFQLWPDSFLTAAFSDLEWEREDAKKRLAQAGFSWRLKTEGLQSGSEGIFFPQLEEGFQYALNDGGLVAVNMDGMLHILDMNQGLFTQAACAVKRNRHTWGLYWEGTDLIVRYEKQRIRYRFQDNQLVEWDSRSCIDGLKLFDPKTVLEAGGWREAESCASNPDPIFYHTETQAKIARLFYPKQQNIVVRVHNTFAALILDGNRLEVVDLDQETVLYRRDISVITSVEWSPSGKELLVVHFGNTLMRVPVDCTQKIGHMPGPLRSFPAHLFREAVDMLSLTGRGFYSLAVYLRKPEQHMLTAAQYAPLFGAMSVKHNWLACYYQMDSGSFLAVYRLSEWKRMFKPMKTDRIAQAGSIGDLLYPARDRNGLILVTKLKTMLLDLEQEKWLSAPASARRQPEQEPALYGHLRETYAEHTARKLYLPEPPQKAGRFFRKKAAATDHSHQRLNGVEVLGDGTFFWLVDRVNGIVQVFDAEGRCLGKNMTAERILACDYADRKLYLLLEKTELLLTIHLE